MVKSAATAAAPSEKLNFETFPKMGKSSEKYEKLKSITPVRGLSVQKVSEFWLDSKCYKPTLKTDT